MYNFTLQLRTLFFGFLLAGLAALPCAAQTKVEARNYQDNRTFRTNAPELAVDGLLTTSATLSPVLAGVAALRVTFPVAVQTGQQGILIIKSSTSLATVLDGLSVRTYSTSATNPDAALQYMEMSNASLLKVSVAPNDPSEQQVTFTATKAFNQIELAVGTLLNTDYSVNVYAVSATVAPLPVQLTTFQGKASEAGVTLNWATASERNADYFEVQRAEGLTSSFSSLGQVKSAGTSTQAHTYQFVDAHATGLHYYRLRQVDTDGTEVFSPVVTVDGGLVASLTAYPTVATQLLHVTGAVGTRFHILNQQGQQVQAADLAANQPQQVDVSNLPGGVYFLRDAASGQSTRFMKSSGR